jgi:hypothetical protein
MQRFVPGFMSPKRLANAYRHVRTDSISLER